MDDKQREEWRVVVAPPTSVGHIVPPDSIARHCDALRDAHSVAERRKRGYRTDQPGGER